MHSKGTPMTGPMKTEKTTSFYGEMKITENAHSLRAGLKILKK
jgi:hypothetical protein